MDILFDLSPLLLLLLVSVALSIRRCNFYAQMDTALDVEEDVLSYRHAPENFNHEDAA